MQDAQSQADRVRAAMSFSIEQQPASVLRQQQAAVTQSNPPPQPTGTGCEPIANPQLAAMIDDASRKHDVDPALVREVARQESGFRPCVVSPKGAEGLMQLMPATQAQLQVRDP